MTSRHLAQLNIARALAPIDSSALAELVALLAPINALAESSPGVSRVRVAIRPTFVSTTPRSS